MRENISDGLWSSVWSPAKHMSTLEWGGSERLEAKVKTGLHCETELPGRMGTESFLGLPSGHQPSHWEVAQPQSLWAALPISSSHFCLLWLLVQSFCPLTEKHTCMCGAFLDRLSLAAGSLTDTEDSDREESWHAHSWGSYFPVHQPLSCCGSPGPRKLHRSSRQACLMGSICRKPPPG